MMLEQIANYLEKIGYTAEQQGSIEKYLVVFLKGRPLGFVLSDGSVQMVSGAEGADSIQDILNFLKKNENLQSMGKGEFLLASYRSDRLTTFYDGKDKIVRYVSYIHNGSTGEVNSTIYESYDDAVFRFVKGSGMINFKKYLPRKESFADRTRERLIRYLISKSNHKAERL